MQFFRIHIKRFNPHSRKGSDEAGQMLTAKEILVSIHTPARGVTRTTDSSLFLKRTFQSTLPQGE